MNVISMDTICAIATASGPGAISLIRVSGQDAFKIVQAVFKGKNLSEQKPYTIHFGSIVEDQQVVDEVLVSVFKNPKSYTGEDLLEISCHGSSFIQQKIIHLLLKQGARIANRGEFTLRAFLNGKLNLSQAEAVADLIASDNEAQHSIAMQQMRGGFQSDLSQLREKLINFAAFIELELDFSEEDVEFVDRTQLLQLLKEIKQKLLRLSDSFFHGNAIKQGIYYRDCRQTQCGQINLTQCFTKRRTRHCE
jgi:tRNA modification GTPase